MPSGWFPFGSDTEVYRPAPDARRSGVVFYAKPDVPRRAFRLGTLALEEFARRRPEAPIHLFGAPVRGLPFPAHLHGSLSPQALNAVYNTCRVGLSLSMTNVSLIPWELLAAGVVPVVNDADHNRIVLDNEHVVWSEPNPHALAGALDDAYELAAQPGVAEKLGASVRLESWSRAADRVLSVIEGVVRS